MSLLPDALAARAAAEEAEAWRRQSLDRARMRAAADWLERRARRDPHVFRRGEPEMNGAGRGGDLTELLRAARRRRRCRRIRLSRCGPAAAAVDRAAMPCGKFPPAA